MNIRLVLASGAALGAIAFASPVFAQSSPATEPVAEEEGGIVVTARRLDEARERDHAATGFATKQGDDGVMSGRGLHVRSVMRSFPLRQTNRD